MESHKSARRSARGPVHLFIFVCECLFEPVEPVTAQTQHHKREFFHQISNTEAVLAVVRHETVRVKGHNHSKTQQTPNKMDVTQKCSDKNGCLSCLYFHDTRGRTTHKRFLQIDQIM